MAAIGGEFFAGNDGEIGRGGRDIGLLHRYVVIGDREKAELGLAARGDHFGDRAAAVRSLCMDMNDANALAGLRRAREVGGQVDQHALQQYRQDVDQRRQKDNREDTAYDARLFA